MQTITTTKTMKQKFKKSETKKALNQKSCAVMPKEQRVEDHNRRHGLTISKKTWKDTAWSLDQHWQWPKTKASENIYLSVMSQLQVDGTERTKRQRSTQESKYWKNDEYSLTETHEFNWLCIKRRRSAENTIHGRRTLDLLHGHARLNMHARCEGWWRFNLLNYSKTDTVE